MQIPIGVKCDLRAAKSLTRTQYPVLFGLFFPLCCLNKGSLRGPSSHSPYFKCWGKMYYFLTLHSRFWGSIFGAMSGHHAYPKQSQMKGDLALRLDLLHW